MLSLCALLACIALPALGDVHVVDPGGGEGKALLQQALDAAQSGDIVLLRAGVYGPSAGPLAVTGKALTIVADTDVSGIQLPALVIEGVPAGSAFVIRDLDVKASTSEDETLRLEDSGGAMWLEGVHVAGVAQPIGTGTHALVVHGGHAVVVRSGLFGANAPDSTLTPTFYGVGGSGLRLANGQFALVMESVVRGGDGGDGAPFFKPSEGGSGATLFGGTFISIDSVVQGGPEGSDTQAKPGKGGAGVQLIPYADPALYLRATLLDGGPATSGVPGPPLSDLPTVLVEWPAAPRSLELPPLVRSRHAGQLVANGQPGDLVAALIALEGMPGAPLLGLQGVLLVPPTSPAVTLGAIDPLSGGLTVTFVLPELPSGVEGLRVFAQGVFLGQEGLTLGSASAMAWIDERF